LAAKLRVHVKNNHASAETFPPTIEGEAVFTITAEKFQLACDKYPQIADQIEVFIDWDLDNFQASMKTADVLVAWDLPTANLATIAPELRWIHIIGAGVEHLWPMSWLPNQVTIVNNRGTHAAKGGEFGLMAVLMLNNRLPAIIENQKTATWSSLFSTSAVGKTLVVIGVGHIGAAAARHCQRLGMRVIGVSRHGRPVEKIEQIVTTVNLDEVLPEADFVLMAVPLTVETRKLLDRRRQALMPSGAGIINLGRSATVDYPALVDNLVSGHFSGAVLDVFDPEPLPDDSILWRTPNLLVTPHISADDGNSYVEMTLDLVFANLARTLRGEPLQNVVNPELGY
jgi:phosphoglycerate dehydrogenase-like enzyme|tara:strand:- start:31 stop:1053 length:1023 start_codon:yes stop_codon:yes gene_type:complete